MSKKARTYIMDMRLYCRHIKSKSTLKCRQCGNKLKIGDKIHSKSNSNAGNQLKLYCINCAKRLHLV